MRAEGGLNYQTCIFVCGGVNIHVCCAKVLFTCSETFFQRLLAAQNYRLMSCFHGTLHLEYEQTLSKQHLRFGRNRTHSSCFVVSSTFSYFSKPFHFQIHFLSLHFPSKCLDSESVTLLLVPREHQYTTEPRGPERRKAEENSATPIHNGFASPFHFVFCGEMQWRQCWHRMRGATTGGGRGAGEILTVRGTGADGDSEQCQ